MKKCKCIKFALVASICFVANFALYAAVPTITGFSPNSGTVGTTVTITGTNFNTTLANNIVFFGATQATVTAATSTSLTVTVPTGATYAPISVSDIATGLTAYSTNPFNVISTGGGALLSKVDYATGTTPFGVAIGDVDGDGKPDVVVANSGSATVSVFCNTGSIGSPSFASKVDYTTGTSPYGVAIGDVDGDGKPDLVVTNSISAGTVSVFRNTCSSGTISFAAKVDYTTGSTPRDVAIRDMDGDGKPDMVVANSGSASVSVFRNTSSSGTISFAAKVDYTVGTTPTSIAIGDIDGDGKPDVVVTNYGSTSVSVLLNTSSSGTISFAAKVDYTTGTNPNVVSLGDVDGDGKPDLAVTNYGSATVSVFRNTSIVGILGFDAKVDFTARSGSNGLGIGDIDGDGKPDIIANSGSAIVSVLRNTCSSGTISFQTKVDYKTGSSPRRAVIGDMDGDGKPDIVVTNGSSATFSVLRNIGIPTISTFAPASGIVGTTVTITGTYFNTTAANNIVFFGATQATVTAATATSLTVTVPTGATYAPVSVSDIATGLTAYSTNPFNVISPYGGAFINKVINTSATDYESIAIGDLDGDGKPDLAVTDRSANLLSVFRNTGSIGSPSLAAKVDYTTGTAPEKVIIGDVDGDGKLDLMCITYASNTLSVFRNTGSSGTISFAAKVNYTTASYIQALAIGDIDGDGKPDIVTDGGSSAVSIFRNESSVGTISYSRVDYPCVSNQNSITISDLDGDSKPDLVIIDNYNSKVSILRNTSSVGTISFAAQVDYTISSPQRVAIGDVDGDGKPDLAITNGSIVSVFRNTCSVGTISFAANVNYTAEYGARSVSIGDVDGDGKPDLIVSGYNEGQVSFFRNMCSSGIISFATKVNYNILSGGVYDTVLCDIDGDGNQDITALRSTEISVLRNIGIPTLTGFTPISGGVGTTVTITGTNLTDVTAVSFGGTAATSFTVVSPTNITAVVAAGASGNVSVTTLGGTASLTGFTWVAAPTNLSYTASNVYTKGTAITALTPAVTGGVDSYSISPALPAGLSLNTASGEISGTPTAITANATYTITATNTGGSATKAIDIKVVDVIPSGLTYPVTNTFTKGTAITALTSTVSGGAVETYSVSPALPAGLSLNTATGEISGTPTVVAANATYTITATNTGGSTTKDIAITVNDVAPASLSYSTPDTFTKGIAITALTPTVSGGAVVSYSVSPALPAGLSLNTSTGIISGTPTAITANATYTVTATNTGGNTSKAIDIKVVDVIPSGLTYTTPNTFTKGTAISTLTPTANGGAVETYSISPALPVGLSLNTGTGEISGTPTAITANATYTITATNTGGSTSKAIDIKVVDVIPSGLTYSASNTFTKGTAITALTPTVSGGPVVSYSVSPALPAGLSLNTATGEISGTPTAITANATYTITATNTGGSATKAIDIKVVDVIPSGLTYPVTNTFTKGTAITALTPTVSGGTVVSYSVSPALPAGLSLNTSTGEISGTPTTVTANGTYTITATNTGGSTNKAIDIKVNDIAPNDLTYSNSTVSYIYGTAISSNTPTSNGGSVLTYTISPSLPAGLSLNASTGEISGTPTELSASATYLVTAENTGGTATCMLVLGVDKKAITLTGVIAKNKEYDGNNNAVLEGGTLNGIVSGDIVSITAGTGFFSDKNVATGKTVTVSGYSLGGADANKYVLGSQPTGIVAAITGRLLTVTASAANKVYDGSTSASVSLSDNRVAGDQLSVSYSAAEFATRTKGTSKTVTVKDLVLTGTDVGNYILSANTTTATADITERLLTVTVIGGNKAYDGTTTATVSFADDRISGDQLTVGYSTATFDDENKGVGKTITVTGISISGVDADNYILSSTTALTTGNISLKLLTVSAVASNKEYDGGSIAVVTLTDNRTAGESINVTYSSAGFIDKHVGVGKTVTISGLAISGADASKYSLTATTITTTADITAKAVSITGISADSKVYDGTTTVTTSGGSLSGVVSGDDVSYKEGTIRFTDANAGDFKSLVVSGFSLSGNDASNYILLSQPTVGTADIVKATQVITFQSLGTKVLGDGSFTAIVSGGSSGNPVLLTSSNPAVATVSGNVISIVGLGSTVIEASQAGDSNYESAQAVERSLQVVLAVVAPKDLSYPVSNNFTKGVTIGSITPTVSGGVVTSYRINPSLPAGLDLNAVTGEISGTPTALSDETTYTITASNDIGSTDFAMKIAVKANVNIPVLAGDTNGDGKIDTGEILGDTNGDGKIDGTEIAGDANGDGSISTGEISGNTGTSILAGDRNGDGKIDNGEILGDTNGDGKIDGTEIAGDTNGDSTISTGETAGNIGNNSTTILAGDRNGDGKIDNGEILGDTNGDGKIDGTEIAGDTNGDGTISTGETAGNIGNNSTTILAGDRNGDGKIDNGEILGDTNGDGKIDGTEIAGDTNGDGTISTGETAGNTGDNTTTILAGDTNGNGKIDGTEIAGDTNGNGRIDGNEVDATTINISPLTTVDNPVTGCENSILELPYSLLSGAPTQYRLSFDAVARAAGLQNTDYTALPGNSSSAIVFSIPQGIADGTYHGTIQLRNSVQESEPYAFEFTVNVSPGYIVRKFDDVLLIDNSTGRFAGYQWFKNGVAIVGATEQFYSDPEGLSGSYSVDLTTVDGKKLSTCGKSYSGSSSKKVKAYPNPAKANQNITLELIGFASSELSNAKLMLFDLSGNLVYLTDRVEVNNQFNLPTVTGIYVGHVISTTGADYSFKVEVIK